MNFKYYKIYKQSIVDVSIVRFGSEAGRRFLVAARTAT